LIDKESRNINIDREGEKSPAAGQLDTLLLVARKDQLRPFDTIPI
jgi:hypothetical protein